ncbi:MerR family transcriptional regulator [Lacinutrix jangbogonensis]|uniref:MerR family transcriptional regulator n=1 Tax=Lacinutrix jangbogonensis TaxID=1469557 RepID=UPI00053EC89C|nr:MerR family transcriptional regulator [Lacinutrix jangbogonensis]
MNNIKTKFSIKDLENLSGIKAHTIRIWEKRYSLFQPNRSETNIRNYSLKSLQRILNISYLNKNGFKISKIAKLNDEEISLFVNEISEKQRNNNSAINAFKMSMFSFDQSLFYSTFNELASKYTFTEIFYLFFVPFLDEIGLLWQTDTLTPAHEHFIVELIKQKILVNTEKAISKTKVTNKDQAYVLFLPANEVHELGLLFINYELSEKGLHTIYLGQSVPTDSLEYVKDYYNDITFISSFTVKPEAEIIDQYIQELTRKVLLNTNNKLYISGRQAQAIDTSLINDQIFISESSEQVLNNLTFNNHKVVNSNI